MITAVEARNALAFEEDIAVLGIFEESHVAVKAIETKLGQSLKWETKNTDSIVADNPKRPGFIEIRRVFMNSPLFETSANA